MRGHSILLDAACWLLFVCNISASVFYVDVNSTNPVPPYAGWGTAATNIQAAVDTASAGDTVLVTNGVYATGGRKAMSSADITNRVVLTNSIIVRSVNGAGVTVIEGTRIPGTVASTSAVRCAFVGSGSVLSGFTLTNGEAGLGNFVNGGGVAGNVSGVVSNCVITGNVCGGAGSGALGVSLINCVLAGNYGVGAAAQSALNNCVITNNIGPWAAGLYGCKATNCLVAFNRATNYGGGTAFSTMVSCTVTANSLAPGYNGNGGGSYNDTLHDCIVYDNSAPNGSNYYSSGMTFCCSAPLPGGTGNISNEPLFVNLSAGDYHLTASSPCINAGDNSFFPNSTDLDGNPRIVGGIVDMGAYEFQSPIHFVALNNTNPISPFTNWLTAATNIQDAVDASTNGDVVLVTNGIYQSGGREINGEPPTNRVVAAKIITLMSVNGPAATAIEGYQMPGVINGAAAIRCVYLTNGAVLAGFTLTNGGTYNDMAGGLWNLGGAVFCQSTNPTIELSSAVVSNCWLTGNSASGPGVAYGGILNNCILDGNSGGGASYCILNGCTVVSNSSSFDATVHFSTANNCILYFNNAPNNNWGSTVNYCCTTPLAVGMGNITNDPVLVNLAGGDFHLQSNSPCINAGNNAHVTASDDFDGNPRIVGGTVDIGAYEYQTPSSIISYAWLQQYDLPTDGSADYADSDGDGMNNYAEWKAGTNPTNAASVLALQAPATTNTNGISVTWQSVSGVTYYLQSSTNLPAFTSIQSNIVGLAGSTSYTDTTATNGGPYFYRVGVQ